MSQHNYFGYGNAKTKEKGKEREHRFWLAFTKYLKYVRRDAPEWFKGIRRATLEEDKKGCDFFILTDVGELGINVKSSYNAVDSFTMRQQFNERNSKIAAIPVGCSLDHFQCIRLRTFNVLYHKRKALISSK